MTSDKGAPLAVNKKKKRFLVSIKTELLVSFLLVVVLVASISIGFVSLFMKDYTDATIQRKLGEDADLLAKYEAQQSVFTQDAIESMYDKIVRNNFMIIILRNDLTVFDSRNTDSLEASSSDFGSEFKDSISPLLDPGGAGMLTFNGITYPVYTQCVISRDGELLGYVVLLAPYSEAGGATTAMGLYVVAILLASVFAIAISALIANMLTVNLKRLKTRAKLLAQRKFDAAVEIYSRDEIADLAESIEEMARGMQTYEYNQKVFLQNASHELRTPLMSIRGYTEGLRDGIFTDMNEACGLILEQTQRLEKVVNEVLYLSKIETSEGAIHMTSITLKDVFEEVNIRVQGLFVGTDIKFTVCEIPDVVLTADGDSLATALTNVISNNIRYAHTQIVVEIDDDVKDRVTIRIYDDGDGFNENDLPHIFERFYKGSKGKFGLGLSIVKAITEAHGGVVTARNRIPDENGKSRGALFEITLPLDGKTLN